MFSSDDEHELVVEHHWQLNCLIKETQTDAVVSSNDRIVSELSEILGVVVDMENIHNLSEYPCVLLCVKNILLKRGPSKKIVNQTAHDKGLKATVSKFALKHSYQSAIELSNLVGGPKESTIAENIRPDVKCLSYFADSNIMEHLHAFRGKFCLSK